MTRPSGQTPQYGGFDVDRAVEEVRLNMHLLSDDVARATASAAQGYARHMLAQFAGQDLRLVAHTLLTSSASLGMLVDNNMGRTALNVQAVAAVALLDHADGRQALA